MADLVAGRTSSSPPPLQWLAVTLAHSGFSQKQRRLGKKREGLGSVGLLVQGEEDGAAGGIEAETPSLGCCGWFWRESVGCVLLNLRRGSWFGWSFFGKERGQRLWFSFCPDNGETPGDGSGGLVLGEGKIRGIGGGSLVLGEGKIKREGGINRGFVG
ncbi:hypothetical protein Peur_032857 [Populus x canadensis]